MQSTVESIMLRLSTGLSRSSKRHGVISPGVLEPHIIAPRVRRDQPSCCVAGDVCVARGVIYGVMVRDVRGWWWWFGTRMLKD